MNNNQYGHLVEQFYIIPIMEKSDELEKINRGVCSFYEKYSSIQK